MILILVFQVVVPFQNGLYAADETVTYGQTPSFSQPAKGSVLDLYPSEQAQLQDHHKLTLALPEGALAELAPQILSNNRDFKVEISTYSKLPVTIQETLLTENTPIIVVEQNPYNPAKLDSEFIDGKIPSAREKKSWVQYRNTLQSMWITLRIVAAGGAFYISAITTTSYTFPAVLAGAIMAGTISLYFAMNNSDFNQWILKPKIGIMKVARYFLASAAFFTVPTLAPLFIDAAATGNTLITLPLIYEQLINILKGASVGTLTQGAWNLWNAQWEANNIKKIDPNLPFSENQERREDIKSKSNFFSFVNSITNNSLSTYVTIGGESILVDWAFKIIAASGALAYYKNRPELIKCSEIF
jgi:hypothetical protein